MYQANRTFEGTQIRKNREEDKSRRGRARRCRESCADLFRVKPDRYQSGFSPDVINLPNRLVPLGADCQGVNAGPELGKSK